mmetsp:Transcript_2850/g.8704  ORF Transcript_2850/g.8704 Transcript_2850/m.8704 type:complete len:97 (-) Transcript_2850:255-545(-)
MYEQHNNLELPYRAVLCDLRCQGQSADGDGDISWDANAREVSRLVKHLWDRPCALFAMGHSLGATALLFSELGHPDSFRAAVVAEPVSVPSTLHQD